DDLQMPGCLHAAMLRTPHAHARIRAIDASSARGAPGVVGVFTVADLGCAGEPIPIYAPHPALPIACRIRPLAADRVRFVGEAVAGGGGGWRAGSPRVCPARGRRSTCSGSTTTGCPP